MHLTYSKTQERNRSLGQAGEEIFLKSMGKYFILKEVQMNGELLLGKLKLFTELFHSKALLFLTILQSQPLVDYEIVLIFILITKSLVTLIKEGLNGNES